MPPAPLRLLAEDAEDLAVMSAACQDGLARVGDIRFDRVGRRCSIVFSRFRWETAGARGPYERVRASLSFEAVLAMRARQVRTDDPDALTSVLALAFEPSDAPPSGMLRITLAGGGELALEVECLDGRLIDLGPRWPTQRRPDHERR